MRVSFLIFEFLLIVRSEYDSKPNWQSIVSIVRVTKRRSKIDGAQMALFFVVANQRVIQKQPFTELFQYRPAYRPLKFKNFEYYKKLSLNVSKFLCDFFLKTFQNDRKYFQAGLRPRKLSFANFDTRQANLRKRLEND